MLPVAIPEVYQRTRQASKQRISPVLPGGNSEREPPDPIPNSEVKTFCADGSVAFSHARVGHCQAPHAIGPDARKSVGAFSLARDGYDENAEPAQSEQARSLAQNPDGLAHGAQFGRDDAGGLGRSDPAGTERMDLLGHLGQTRTNAQPPNPTRGRGASGGQTPPLLLARLSASPPQREEVVRETIALTHGWQHRARTHESVDAGGALKPFGS